MQSKFDLIASKAKQDKKLKFSVLIHHINEENLLQCYRELNRNKACGIDDVTYEEYGRELEANIKLLVQKLRAKEYRPKPVRRVYIPKHGKEDEKRALGIPTLEDKLVQLMIKKILEPIFEANFRECSHGFRPGKSCHTAIKSLNQTIMKSDVKYIVEVDIRKFFDSVQHYWLLRCIEERVSDPNMIWLIKRFLKAGVIEANAYRPSEVGTPQGGVISPLLANIYLHYVLDLWFDKVVVPKARDQMQLIRYCDDWVVCCNNKKDAEEFLTQLTDRLYKFKLEVNPDKTKIIKFGRQSWKQWKRGANRAGSFTFLGFTHYCGTSRQGGFSVMHKTAKQNLQRMLKGANAWLKKIRNMLPLKEWWKTLKAKLLGHYRYFGVSGNYRCISRFYDRIRRMVFKWINRRSQKKSMNWQQFEAYNNWDPLPQPKIYCKLYEISLPFGNASLKSPVWENHKQGSVRVSITMKQKLVKLNKE